MSEIEFMCHYCTAVVTEIGMPCISEMCIVLRHGAVVKNSTIPVPESRFLSSEPQPEAGKCNIMHSIDSSSA